jgi:hypothetical protein
MTQLMSSQNLRSIMPQVPSERVSVLELQSSVLKKTARDRAERIR